MLEPARMARSGTAPALSMAARICSSRTAGSLLLRWSMASARTPSNSSATAFRAWILVLPGPLSWPWDRNTKNGCSGMSGSVGFISPFRSGFGPGYRGRGGAWPARRYHGEHQLLHLNIRQQFLKLLLQVVGITNDLQAQKILNPGLDR